MAGITAAGQILGAIVDIVLKPDAFPGVETGVVTSLVIMTLGTGIGG